MRIRLKVDVSGTRDGQTWPRRGEEIDLPDDEAASMCANGQAEPVAVDDVETATAADTVETTVRPLVPEVAVAPVAEKRRPGRPRKAE